MTQENQASPLRRITSAVLATLLAVCGMFGFATAASAAPDVTYPDAISHIQLTKEDGSDGPLHQWESVRITADWSVPDGAQAGETFGMSLPQEFTRWGSGNFDITDPDSGEVMATCTVSQGGGPEVVCTLTDAVTGKENIGGSFWMSAQVSQSTTEETVEFEVGDELIIVDLPGEGGVVPEDLTEAENPYKYSGETSTDGRFLWTIGVPSGYVRNGGFDISDQLDPNQEYHSYTGELQVIRTSVEDGQMVGDWTTVDPSKYTVTWADDMKSFDFTASGLDAGTYHYRVMYYTQADGVVVEGDVFGNRATVGNTTTSSQHRVESHGGGTGTGDQYTRFTITKALTGDAAALASQAEFTVQYSVVGSDADPKRMTVPVGQEVRSDRAPLGSTFLVEELDFPEIEGVSWGDWTLAGDGVSRNEDGTYSVTPGTAAGVSLTLTNEARAAHAPVGTIAWKKVNPDGDLLTGSEWELVGPNGVVITVTDNGASDANPAEGALLVQDLPYGEYTLTETKAPQGYDLLDASLTVTVDAENAAASFGDVENTPTAPAPPTEPDEPSEPSAPGQPEDSSQSGLARTGTSMTGLAAIAAILLAAGVTLVIARRRTTVE
ncbi:hypothetical protein D3248_03195 [Leucobacter zeae]|nr:hypothetical protein [Leucobacter zeae]